MTTSPNKPALDARSKYIDLMKDCNNLVELSAVRTEYTVDSLMDDLAKGVLKSRYDIEAMRISNKFKQNSSWNSTWVDVNVARVAESHAQDDNHNFATPEIANQVFDTPTPPAPIEIITTNSNPNPTTNENPNQSTISNSKPIDIQSSNNGDTTDSIKLDSSDNNIPSINSNVATMISSTSTGEVEWAERQTSTERTRVPRKTKAAPWSEPTNSWRSYRIVRRINTPIKWIDYSNNDWTVEVTAPTLEDAQEQIGVMIEQAIQSYELFTKDRYDSAVKKAYVEWEEHGKANAPKPQQQATVIQAPTKVQYSTNDERLKQMLTQVMNSIPWAKGFMEQFSALNPKIPTNQII